LKDNMSHKYKQALDFLSKLIEYVDDVDAILKDVANHYDADRAYIFEFSQDRKTIDNTEEWCKEGVEPQIDNLQNIPYESVAVWVREFEKVGAFFISSLDKDVDENSLTYEILEPQGIESLIAAPIYKDDNIIGFIGVDNPHSNTDDLAILKVTASILYSEISKKISKKNHTIEKMTKEQQTNNAMLDEIQDIVASANMGIWRIELVENKEPKMFVDETMKKLLGTEGQNRSPEKTYDDWFDNVSPDAVSSVLKSVERMKQGYFDENTYLWQHPTKGTRYVRCGGTAKKISGGYSLQGYHYDVDEVVRKTQTDEMTGLLNRRAYEEIIFQHNNIPIEDKFIYVSIDANGLKVVNDTKGHVAGDELLIGVSECMKKSLSSYGKLFRTGGDEFVAFLFCDKDEVKKVLKDFDNTIANWKGKLIDKIAVSYGYVDKHEMIESSIRELGAVADQRMYESKSDFYKKQGFDRRGQQDAHKKLCELYTKILKINISDDAYVIVNMDSSEKTDDGIFSDKISEWLISFGKAGLVHPDDLDEYLKKTDLNYIKEYFSSGKTSLHIFYRRKYNDEFKQVMMELVPANNYSDDDMNLFLYVKNIDK